MNIENFTQEFAGAIEVEPGAINAATEFKELDMWDSLAMLVVIAMVDSRCNVSISGQDLADCTSIADLYALVSRRMK